MALLPKGDVPNTFVLDGVRCPLAEVVCIICTLSTGEPDERRLRAAAVG